MNQLQQFLLATPANDLTKEIDLGGRLRGQPFTIKVLPPDQYSSFQNLCIENPNSPKKRRFNTRKFNELVVVNCVINPNLKDPEFMKAAGVPDATSLMYKVLLAGEVTTLAEEVLRLSGFDRDFEEEMDEVKNS